jgi:lysophospholipase L1-like esterase
MWLLAVLTVCGTGVCGEGAVLDAMDALSFSPPKEKGAVELVDGKVGKAIQFSFKDACSGIFSMGKLRGKPEWDQAAGFSFWVKGDGSNHLGGLQFVWNEDYALRYTYAFPIDSTEWKKITVAWRDLTPVLSKADVKPCDAKNGNAPSKLGNIWFGKWFFWKDYAAHSYAIDEICLEPTIELDNSDYKPAGEPLARVLAKIKAKQPVTLVTTGDSLSAVEHWANKNVLWQNLLKQMIKTKYGSDVTIVNPAIGGTELLQGLVIIPRWIKEAPEPDLVTIFYGGNDREGGMTAEKFVEVQKDAVLRMRRATKGKADLLIMATAPSLKTYETTAPLADACKKAAEVAKAGICDIFAAFKAVPPAEREKLFATLPGTNTCEGVHMGAAGHELIARNVLEALERAGK